MKTITAIQVGIGESCNYYKLDSHGVSEIKEERKDVGPGLLTVYRVYSKSGIICEIEAGIGVILYF